MTKRRIPIAAMAAAVAALMLAGCTTPAPDEPTGELQDIVFWTPHVTPERLAKQQAIAQSFEAATGIAVEVVPLTGADQNQALVTGAASGDVPDVILHAPDQTAAWRDQGLLDTEVAQEIVDELGIETFNPNAIDLVSLDDEVGAVPSDGWVHLIVYRKDLFEAAGVDVPTNLAELAEAATAMAETGITGMAMGTQSGTPSGTEAVESIFQTGGCQLVTDGEVVIDSEECTDAAAAFKELAESSAVGDFDVPSARATYLAGNAAMLLFSTHILDELAGLDPNNPVTCSECTENPKFLAENSGLITVLDEENAAQYGTVLSYGVPVGANSREAKMFIEYLMNEGYLYTLATATEGRIPVRLGTPDNPDQFITGWGELAFGPNATNNLSISAIYGEDVVEQIRNGVLAIKRWGFGTPDAPLEGAVFSQGILSQNLADLYASDDPSEITKQMAEQVRTVQSELD